MARDKDEGAQLIQDHLSIQPAQERLKEQKHQATKDSLFIQCHIFIFIKSVFLYL